MITFPLISRLILYAGLAAVSLALAAPHARPAALHLADASALARL
jgi:hypothetical protein